MDDIQKRWRNEYSRNAFLGVLNKGEEIAENFKGRSTHFGVLMPH